MAEAQVIIDATNAADDPVMFGTDRQSRESVRVVIGTNAAGIRGRVVVPTDGKPPRNSYSVAVFAVNSDRWSCKNRGTRRQRASGSTAALRSPACLLENIWRLPWPHR